MCIASSGIWSALMDSFAAEQSPDTGRASQVSTLVIYEVGCAFGKILCRYNCPVHLLSILACVQKMKDNDCLGSVGGELGTYKFAEEHFGLYIDPILNLTTCQPASMGGKRLELSMDGRALACIS